MKWPNDMLRILSFLPRQGRKVIMPTRWVYLGNKKLPFRTGLSKRMISQKFLTDLTFQKKKVGLVTAKAEDSKFKTLGSSPALKLCLT